MTDQKRNQQAQRFVWKLTDLTLVDEEDKKASNPLTLTYKRRAFDESRVRRDNDGQFAVKPGGSNGPTNPTVKAALITFSSAGGTVSRVSGRKAAEEAEREIDQLLEIWGEGDDGSLREFYESPQLRYTQEAIEWAKREPDAELLIARHPTYGPVGALALVHKNDEDFGAEFLYVEVLGSMGLVKGTGSVLAAEAARIGKEKGLPVLGQATPSSAPFWKRLGWRSDPNDTGMDILGWDLDDLDKVAR